MIADLIAYWLFPRGVFVDFTDNVERAKQHHKRAAEYRAADPAEFNRRYLKGIAVQQRARSGKRKNNVLALRRAG